MPDEEGYVPKSQCPKCGISVVEGNLSCPNCGTTYSSKVKTAPVQTPPGSSSNAAAIPPMASTPGDEGEMEELESLEEIEPAKLEQPLIQGALQTRVKDSSGHSDEAEEDFETLEVEGDSEEPVGEIQDEVDEMEELEEENPMSTSSSSPSSSGSPPGTVPVPASNTPPQQRAVLSVPTGPVPVREVKSSDNASPGQYPPPPQNFYSPPLNQYPPPLTIVPQPPPNLAPTQLLDTDEEKKARDNLVYISFSVVAIIALLQFLVNVALTAPYISPTTQVIMYATYLDPVMLIASAVLFVMLMMKYGKGKRFQSDAMSSLGTRVLIADLILLSTAVLTILAAGFSDSTWMLESPYPVLVAIPIFGALAFMLAQVVRVREKLAALFIYTTGMFILASGQSVVFLNVFGFSANEIPVMTQFVMAIGGIHLLIGVVLVIAVGQRQRKLTEEMSMGITYFDQERYDMAIVQFDKAAVIAHDLYAQLLPDPYVVADRRAPPPEYIRPWYLKAQALMRMKMYKKALAHFELVLILDTSNPKVWNAKGESLVQLERKNEAADCFRTALSLKPDFEDARDNLESIQ